jgi:hypothetical protein
MSFNKRGKNKRNGEYIGRKRENNEENNRQLAKKKMPL